MESLPVVSGKQLISLLKKDGWQGKRRANHGVSLYKYNEQLKRTLVTIIPDKSKDLPEGTLAGILGMKQTRIGRNGLLELIQTHGI